MKTIIEFELPVDPRKVLVWLKSQPRGALIREVMAEFDLHNLDAQYVLAYLQAKWKVQPKAYSQWLGNRRVPVIRWQYRVGRPKRSKRVKDLERKNEQRRDKNKLGSAAHIKSLTDPRLKGKKTSYE